MTATTKARTSEMLHTAMPNFAVKRGNFLQMTLSCAGSCALELFVCAFTRDSEKHFAKPLAEASVALGIDLYLSMTSLCLQHRHFLTKQRMKNFPGLLRAPIFF
jgi:hypothetical protein